MIEIYFQAVQVSASLLSPGRQGEPREPLFENRPASNISWIITDSSLVPSPGNLPSVLDRKSCLIALYSPQSIVWAGFFPLPTELKLLKLKNQESFSLAFCSCHLIPRGSDYKMPKFWNGARFKGYQRILRENLLINISKYVVTIHVKNVSVSWYRSNVEMSVG